MIGTAALVTEYDTGILIQHHLAKLRCSRDARVKTGALGRAASVTDCSEADSLQQLPADIIDSIVGRVGEIILPLPRDGRVREAIGRESRRIFTERAKARNDLARLFAALDGALVHGGPSVLRGVRDEVEPQGAVSLLGFLGDRGYARSFSLRSASVRTVFWCLATMIRLSASRYPGSAAACDIVTIGQLRATGEVVLGTGDEVGKLAYGTGAIPFVRTSDLGTGRSRATRSTAWL